MDENSTQVFKRAVHYVLTEWPSLNLAIENGMGGSQAKEIQNWMCSTLSNTMLKGKDFDVEDFLAEMINQEFDTLIEDGSLEYNARWIEKFYKDCLNGKHQEVLEQLESAATKKLSLGNMKIPPPVCQTKESSDEEDEDTEGDDVHE